MSADRDINRRDLIVKTAGAASAAGALAGGMTEALAAEPLPAGFADQPPLKEFWDKQLNAVVDVSPTLKKDAPDLAEDGGRERHRIYSYLLMKLITRFWNGNKKGPLGHYPQRQKQLTAQNPERYRGDALSNPGDNRFVWDRYTGHNIACIAVDGNGEIVDFDFNHNEFFRSSAEHAESRMVRRLFSLTSIFDNWKVGTPIADKPRAAQLNDITLYTSLESCAQCSGVMSLAGVKQIVYMQNDFTAYKIGNIMYNLANRTSFRDAQGNMVSLPGAPIPIAGSEVGLAEFDLLNKANLDFFNKSNAAKAANNKEGAFFIPPGGEPLYDGQITSFLCTDVALDIFTAGAGKLSAKLGWPDWKPKGATMSNAQCAAHAQEFYKYADIEGYRGSPHKL
jgi:tRNA(Arg) A34 adenosine deaminase TadA